MDDPDYAPDLPLAEEGDGDVDTCRICSAPAESDAPLFHPCKCSGTIRYIHQECLTTWLAHSKKQSCDVCKHPYSFTKVYAKDMPGRLPTFLLIRRFIQHIFFGCLLVVRGVLVGFVWLAVLPWITVWTWRMYFAMGNSTAWWISARPRAAANASSFFYSLALRNTTSSDNSTLTASSPTNTSLTLTLISHPLFRSISADIFSGQIIAILIVLIFIAIFLLREWISQNARPGVFEDAVAPEQVERENRERAAEREREMERQRQRHRQREQAREERARAKQVLMRVSRAQPRLGEDQAGLSHLHRQTRNLPARPLSAQARALEHRNALYEAGVSDISPGQRQALTRTRTLPAMPLRRRQTDMSPLELPNGLDKGKGRAEDVPSLEDISQGGPKPIVDVADRADLYGTIEKYRSPYALLKAHRVRGTPGAENWSLFDFEMYEMNAREIVDTVAPTPEEEKETEEDPETLFVLAEMARLEAEEEKRWMERWGTPKPANIPPSPAASQPLKVPVNWTDRLGDAVAEAARWRARRQVLYAQLNEEAVRDGLPLVLIPWDLSDEKEEGGEPGEDGMRRPLSRYRVTLEDPAAKRRPRSATDFSFAPENGAAKPRFPTAPVSPLPYPITPSPVSSPASLPPAAPRLAPAPPPRPAPSVHMPAGLGAPPPSMFAPVFVPPSAPRSSSSSATPAVLPASAAAFGLSGQANTPSTVSASRPIRPLPTSALPRPPVSRPASDPFAPGSPPSGPPPDYSHSSRAPPPQPSIFQFAPQIPAYSAPDSTSSTSAAAPVPTWHPSSIPVPRRPPMVSSALPTPTTPPTGMGTGTGTKQKAQTPLASPSLATYQPPEEFQEGSSGGAGYFDTVKEEGVDTVKEEAKEEERRMKEEHARYFKEVGDGEGKGKGKGKRVETTGGVREENGEVGEGASAGVYDGEIPELEVTDEDEDEEETDDGDDKDEDGDEDEEDEEGEEDEEPGREMMLLQRRARGPEGGVGEINVEEDGEGEGILGLQLPEDVEMGGEDDMEGALEAIGMRGPLFVVAQNAALMIFVLDTAIGLGIWLPFTFGKSAALLSLDPPRALQVLHFPIRIMRYVTDPIVDSFLFVVNRVAFPAMWSVVATILGASMWVAKSVLSPFLGRDNVEQGAREVTEYGFALIEDLADRPLEKTMGYIRSFSSSTSTSKSDAPSFFQAVFNAIMESNHPIALWAKAHVEAAREEVRLSIVGFKEAWIRLALGDGAYERILAVALGYAVIGLGLSFYLNVLNVGTVKSAGRAVRSAIRQQLLVVKVAAFIIIELFLFPLGCGFNLDLCSIWMLPPDTTLETRIAFFRQSPLTSIFYHWVIGTWFMHQFASLLADSRTIMRPGAMWFIKDPSDQNFHPIRDILDRSALVQLRKLAVSAVMYGLVVACGVGSVGGLMKMMSSSLLPLRWMPRQPLSNVPVDLLFVHLIMPYTIHYFKPRKPIRSACVHLWRFLSKHLRLSSYMFGERIPAEQHTPAEWPWQRPRSVGDKFRPNFDGSFRRVPASDLVVVPTDMRATAEVYSNGDPVNEEAVKVIAAQNVEATRAKRNPQKDYTVVYIPPNFRYRVMAFITALWVLGSLFVATIAAVPIMLGRRVFGFVTEKEVHDGYSFIVGFYLLWISWFLGVAFQTTHDRRLTADPGTTRWHTAVYCFKRGSVWLAQVVYLVAMLGVVVPVLCGLVVEVYFVLPMRFSQDTQSVTQIRIVDMWALGLLYAKIAMNSRPLQPRTNSIADGIAAIKHRGWANPDALRATTDVVLPLVTGLVGMLVVPPVFTLLIQRATGLHAPQSISLMKSYPALFLIAGLTHVLGGAVHYFVAWSQGVRDLEFLVELRLRNYDNKVRRRAFEERRGGEAGDADAGVVEVGDMADADVELLWNQDVGERAGGVAIGDEGDVM